MNVCCRRYLYNQTAKWLKSGAGNFKVDALYVWTAGKLGNYLQSVLYGVVLDCCTAVHMAGGHTVQVARIDAAAYIGMPHPAYVGFYMRFKHLSWFLSFTTYCLLLDFLLMAWDSGHIIGTVCG